MDKPFTAQPRPDVPSGWNRLIQKLRLSRRRKHYLTDPKNQFRMMRQLLLIFAVGATLGSLNVYIITHFIERLDVTVGAISWSNLYIYAMVLTNLAVWIGLSLVIFFTCLLVFSHRITGAANKLRQALARLSQGDLAITVELRRGDYLHEVAAEINSTARTLRSWLSEMERVVEALRVSAANSESLAEPLATAERLLSRYRAGQSELGLPGSQDPIPGPDHGAGYVAPLPIGSKK